MSNSPCPVGVKPVRSPRILWRGVLDGKSMESGLITLAQLADFNPGDRVQTLRGSMNGTILRVEPDGCVVVKTDTGTELTALPESLLKLR